MSGDSLPSACVILQGLGPAHQWAWLLDLTRPFLMGILLFFGGLGLGNPKRGVLEGTVLNFSVALDRLCDL